jgi:hypothetical protein
VIPAITDQERELWRALVKSSPSGEFTIADTGRATSGVWLTDCSMLEFLYRLHRHGLVSSRYGGRGIWPEYIFLLPHAAAFPRSPQGPWLEPLPDRYRGRVVLAADVVDEMRRTARWQGGPDETASEWEPGERFQREYSEVFEPRFTADDEGDEDGGWE